MLRGPIAQPCLGSASMPGVHVHVMQDKMQAQLLSMQVRLDALSQSAPAAAPASAALPPSLQAPAHSLAVTAPPQEAAPSASDLSLWEPRRCRSDAAPALTTRSGSRWEPPHLSHQATTALTAAQGATSAALQLPGTMPHAPASEPPSSQSPPASKHRRGFSETPRPFSPSPPPASASAGPLPASAPLLPLTAPSERAFIQAPASASTFSMLAAGADSSAFLDSSMPNTSGLHGLGSATALAAPAAPAAWMFPAPQTQSVPAPLPLTGVQLTCQQHGPLQ